MTYRAVSQAACLILSMWGGVALGAPGAPPIYAVIRVGSALADEDRVGAKRAGLLCLPNGTIRWGDVTTGGMMDQREIVQDALEDAGLPVTPLGSVEGRAGRPTLRLRATVRRAGFNLCARRYLGGAKRLSGDVALDAYSDEVGRAYRPEVGHRSDAKRAACTDPKRAI